METRNKTTKTEIKNYDPVRDEKWIMNEIAQFNEQLREMKNANERLRYVSLATSAMMLRSMGSYDLFSATAWGILGYLANQVMQMPIIGKPRREDVQKSYLDKLDRLIQIYAWCCKNGGSVTSDKTFLALLETIAPFVHQETLYPATLQTIEDNKLLSDKFRSVLLTPPHCVLIPKLKESVTPQSDTTAYMLVSLENSSKKIQIVKEDKTVKVDAVKQPEKNSSRFLSWFFTQEESPVSKLQEVKKSEVKVTEEKKEDTTKSESKLTEKKMESVYQSDVGKQITGFLKIWDEPIAKMKRICYGHSTADEEEEVVNRAVVKR